MNYLKKIRKTIAMVMVCLVATVHCFAQSTFKEGYTILDAIFKATEQECVATFDGTKYYSIGTQYFEYFLAVDKTGTLWMYILQESSVMPTFNETILIFREDRQLSRNEVEDIVQNEDPEIYNDVDENGYRYFNGNKTGFIKTPKGNFYKLTSVESEGNFYGAKPGARSLLGVDIPVYTYDILKKRFIRNPKLDDL